MSKYAPLTDHLLSQSIERVTMTLPDLEAVLGFPLPNSARMYYAWWDNDDSSGHTQAKAWLAAGFETANVNLKGPLKVDFVKRAQRTTTPGANSESQHPAYGAMKGMITILPGVDLTEPSYPDWRKLYGEDR